MNHIVIHRHEFTLDQVAQAFGLVEDCLHRRISVDRGMLVVDVVEPGHVSYFEQPPMEADQVEEPPTIEAAIEPPAESVEAPTAPEEADEPEKNKGGPLARRAAILCGEKSFQVFMEVESKEEAKGEVCRRCKITSRADLDHDGDAAEIWNEIDVKYRLWMDGYD